ncbi:gpW family head-tail joining protein [uncultured Deefgea sp.]|uniref:gpW family head-tail joining protein n=1 Tax=uncultured Deefgea sp. TaxID=1304914 RepID=UPI00262C5996|nr:gpW family head-tail joining protein [uncultured Deefgea sp.]
MTDLSTLRLRLVEAENARHKLLTGSLRERINRTGTEITYSRADIDKLERYISTLKGEIAVASGGAGRRVMQQYF